VSKLWCALGMVLVLSACGSNEIKQSKVDVEQRRQIAEENAARETRVR